MEPTDLSDTVLIVDDNVANRHLLRAILEREGYVTEECVNGLECVEFCKERPPMLVLLDVMMPVMDGIEACQTLRKSFSKSELPIIMVTTKVTGADLALGFEAGASDYVNKPIDRNVLLKRIENQMRIIEFQRSLFEANIFTERSLRIQRAMGDALPQAIVVHDSSGTIIYDNKPMKESCGTRVCRAIEEVFELAFEGALYERYQKNYLPILDIDGAIINEDVKTTAGGSERHFHIISKQVQLSTELPSRLWIFRDTTHERLLEYRMNQQVKMETVGLFAAGVAHNFNNLLASILGASDIAKRSVHKPERLERVVRIIQDAVESGMKLTQKMATTKVERTNDKSGGTNFGKVLHEVWGEMSERESFQSIAPEFQQELEDVEVSLTEGQLKVVLQNLIENACEAMDEGGKVICALADEDSIANRIVVSLSDTGHGMDEQTLERAFEPFFTTKNLDQTNNVSCEGQGLGMWNVYNILRMAGANIEIDSVPGEGAMATLTLPKSEENS